MEEIMVHLLKRLGPASWVVMAGIAAMAGLTGTKAQQAAGAALLMPFAEFQPLQTHRSVLVIDVRDAGSFMNGRIPGSMHVPAGEIRARLAAVKKSAKGRLVVTYCSCPTEASSLRAAKELTTAGVTARALVGGFPKWVESGGVIERDAV
jgi:rhodanese-related sulfurtransferase